MLKVSRKAWLGLWGPGAVRPLKNLIAIDDPPISVLDWADRLVVQG
jgi:hypothetical protein